MEVIEGPSGILAFSDQRQVEQAMFDGKPVYPTGGLLVEASEQADTTEALKEDEPAANALAETAIAHALAHNE